MKAKLILVLLTAISPLCAAGNLNANVSPYKIRTLYNSLANNSITQHLAFYQLYPNTQEGQISLKHAWQLLSGANQNINFEVDNLPLKSSIIDSMVNLVNKQADKEPSLLSLEELNIIESLGARLPNRKLKGHFANSEAEVLQLPPDEIDLARGLFLSEMGSTPEALIKVRSYEAMIDLMALQILADLPPNASPETKIRAMNRFIFEDMGFRFPPHSLYAKDVDIYTFLPSVLDSRRGVCLGVSILYICLAQRLDLPLEMITPPGHIYVRYRNGDKVINIETTARGIHLDSEEYLSVDTRSLEERTIKEVIGLAHFNQAAAHLHHEDFRKALAAYQKAEPFLTDDMLLKELMGFTHLLVGNKDEGEALLRQVEKHVPEYAVSGNAMAEDYLQGHVDLDGIRAYFKPVDEKRSSVIEKREALRSVLERNPKFRDGLFSYAVTWLQLHRQGEALSLLEKYHELDPDNPTAEYYLTVLYAGRLHYNKAWEHLRRTEELVRARNHNPKTLKEVRLELSLIAPE